MSKIENAGKFIPAGDTVFRVQENYKAPRVLEIAEDGNGAVKSYRCTDGTFSPEEVVPARAFNDNSLAQLFLESPKTHVFIRPNSDAGVWQYSVEVENSDGFWLIDMAIAENSYYYDSIPQEKRRPAGEARIPKLTK